MPDFALAISKLSRREVLSVLDFLSPNLMYLLLVDVYKVPYVSIGFKLVEGKGWIQHIKVVKPLALSTMQLHIDKMLVYKANAREVTHHLVDTNGWLRDPARTGEVGEGLIPKIDFHVVNWRQVPIEPFQVSTTAPRPALLDPRDRDNPLPPKHGVRTTQVRRCITNPPTFREFACRAARPLRRRLP
jgi:hypothetical protein